MKIFGGKSTRAAKKNRKSKKQKEFEVYTPYSEDFDVMNDGTAPEKPKKKRRVLMIVLILLAVLMAGAAAIVATQIRPPSINRPTNNATINDPENGDAVQIDQGERISDYFTFLVCATDIDETRTDNMLLIGFDTKAHKVNVLNIPRDVMCSNNKTGANKKLNAAYAGGIDNTLKEVAKIVGFMPDKYITVNFNGIAEIVDAIGGVDYEIPFKMVYNDPVQDLYIYFEPGMQHLNGEQVVEFLRWRKNDPAYRKYQIEGYDGSDESRIKKQQEFLMYLADQLLKPSNIFKAKPVAEAVFNNVQTDLSLGEIVWMANQSLQVDTENIQMFTLPGYAASSYAGTSAYLSFYFPNESETLELINTYFNPYDREITDIDVISSPPEPNKRPNHVDTEEDDEPVEAPVDTEDPEETTGDNTTTEDPEGDGTGDTDSETGETGDNTTSPEEGGESTEPSDPNGSDSGQNGGTPTTPDQGGDTSGTTDPGDSGTVSGGEVPTSGGSTEPLPEPDPWPLDPEV